VQLTSAVCVVLLMNRSSSTSQWAATSYASQVSDHWQFHFDNWFIQLDSAGNCWQPWELNCHHSSEISTAVPKSIWKIMGYVWSKAEGTFTRAGI